MPPLREAGLYGSMLVMEVLGAYALLVAVGIARAVALGVGVLWLALLVAVLAGVSTQIARQLPFGDAVRRVFLFGATVAIVVSSTAAAVADRANAVVVLPLVTVAAWRGIAAAVEPIEYDRVRHHFTVGLALVFLGIVWIVVLRTHLQEQEWTGVSSAGIGFLLVGMLGLSVARLDPVDEQTAGRGVSALVAGFLVLLALIAIGALQLFAVDILGFTGILLAPVSVPFGWLFVVIVGFFLAPLFGLLEILRGMHRHAAVQKPRLSHPVAPHQHAVHHGGGAAGEVAVVLLIAFAVAVAAVLLWRLTPSVRRRTKQTARRHDRARSLSTPVHWIREFARWLRSLFQESVEGAGAGIVAMRSRVLGPAYPDDPVRRAYARVLHHAALAGLPRPNSATPAEFEYQALLRWPEMEGDLRELTHAYELRRYGDQSPPSPRDYLATSRRLCKLMRA